MNWKLVSAKAAVESLWLLRNSWGRRVAVFGMIAIVLMALPQFRAKAQIGLDPCCAIISTGLNAISGLLKSVVAKPLSSIQQIQQQAASFEQQVVWPASAINNARGLASQLQGQIRQLRQIDQLPVASATLPSAQRLEQSLLSRNAQAVSEIGQSYTAVYGAVMAPGDAPQPLRDMVDMTDAEAQAAMKKALELDALADIELAAADQINQQIQNAAPGSAPILEAQAAAWVVRANAFTQSAMAELVRVRSVDLANGSAQLKFSASHASALRTTTDQVLGPGAR